MTARPWSRSLLRSVALWLVVGLVLGGAWRGLTPVVQVWSEGYERDVTGDVTLAVLEVTLGVVTAILGLVRSGPGSAWRFGVAVAGAELSALVAWGVGRLLGAPVLTMIAVLVLAPLTVALGTVLGSLVATIVVKEPYADTPLGKWEAAGG